MSLSAIIPVYNEVDNIEPLVAELQAVKSTLPELEEVVFVDDGSTDKTLSALKTAKVAHPWIKIIHLIENAGKSSAQWYGVREAKGDLIITLDGDRQNDPADIPALLRAYQEATVERRQPVFVIGQRARRHDDWLRRTSSKIANRIRQKLLQDDTRDSGCAVRLCRKDDYLALPFFSNMHRFISALALQNGFELVLVDINHRPRVAGVAKYGLWNRLWPGITDLCGMLWLGARRRHITRFVHY